MSKIYTCIVEKDLYRAWVKSVLELSPQDYLFCEDESDLIETVKEDLRCSLNTGDVEYKDYDYTFEIPKEFVNEWKNLKLNLK